MLFSTNDLHSSAKCNVNSTERKKKQNKTVNEKRKMKMN